MTSLCKHCGVTGPAMFSKCFPSEAGNEQRHEFLPSSQQGHKYAAYILNLTKFRNIIIYILYSLMISIDH